MIIDTDYTDTLLLFYKELKRTNIRLSDITYVLAPHYHPDHIGLVNELMNFGVKLLLMDTQIEYVHFSDDIFNRDKHIQYMPINKDKTILAF